MKHGPLFGFPNCLSLSDLPKRASGPWQTDDSPPVIKAALGITGGGTPEGEADDEQTGIAGRVFPAVRTAVRAWPYLFVARDYGGRSTRSLRRRLARIKSAARRQPGIRWGPTNGPASPSTFQQYVAMLEDVEQRRGNQWRRLQSFLSRSNRRFTGSAEFLRRYERQWRSAFLQAMGKDARQFERLLLSTAGRDNGGGRGLEGAITEALRRRGIREGLKRAAFAYASIRCLYGRVAGRDIDRHPLHDDWMVAIDRWRLGDRFVGGPHRERVLKLLKQAKEQGAPPLRHEHRRLRGLGRSRRQADRHIVLASVGFVPFYSLVRRRVLPDGN